MSSSALSSRTKDCGSPLAPSKMPFSSPKRKRSEGMNNSVQRALEGSPKSRHIDKQKQENNRNSNVNVMSFSAPSSSSFMYDSHSDDNYDEECTYKSSSLIEERTLTSPSSSSSSKNRIPTSLAPKTRSKSLSQDGKINKDFHDVDTKCTHGNNNELDVGSKYVPYWSNFELVDRDLGVDRPRSTTRTLFMDDPHDELMKESGIIDDFIASSKTDDDDIVNRRDQCRGMSINRMAKGIEENESFLDSPIEFGKKLCFSPKKGGAMNKGPRKFQQKYEIHPYNSEFIVPSAKLRSSGDSIARLTAQTIPSSPDRVIAHNDDDSWCPACKTLCIGSGGSVNCLHCQRSYPIGERNVAFSTGGHDVSPVPRVGSPQHFDEMEYFPKGSYRGNNSSLDIHDTSDDANISDNSQMLPVSDVSRVSDGAESSCDVTFTDLELNNSTNSTAKSVQSFSSGGGKSGMVLPDQSAFDTSRNLSDRYNSNSTSSPICPPTPQRTPTWVHDTDEASGMHPLGLCRQNSLATSKILFSAQSLSDSGNDEIEGNKTRKISFAKDFEVHGMIGSGTFSDVYLVSERGVPRNRYAVKKSKRQFKSKKDRDLLMNEVKIMGILGNNCANIIQLVRAWQESGFFYVQIDLAERGTLRDLLCDLSQREGIVPDVTIWKIAHDVTNGLHHIHSFGLVHLDIKPANILIGDNGVLKIGDFGMATMQGVGDDGEEGDQRYMAPELLLSMYHRPSADIFSMALTLYETCLIPCLNTLPSDGEKWHDLREGRALVLSGRPDNINDLILKCMAPEPSERPSTEELLNKQEIVDVSTTLDSTLLSAKFRQPTGKKLNRSRSFRPIETESSMSVHSIDTSSSSSIDRSCSLELLRNKTPTNMEGVFAYDFVENNFSSSFCDNDQRLDREDDGDKDTDFPVMGPSVSEIGFRELMEGVTSSSERRKDKCRPKSRPRNTKKTIDFSSPQGVNNDWSTEMSTEIHADQQPDC